MGRIGEPKREIYIPVTHPDEPITEPIAEPAPDAPPSPEPAPVGGWAEPR